jgi:hypothetical protein
MSRMNPKFDKEVDNPICLQIPWVENEEFFEKWKNGQTGYPFIDAGMRQLNQEGKCFHLCAQVEFFSKFRYFLFQDGCTIPFAML